MFASIFYNRSVRRIFTAFASLFTNLTLVRYNNDGSEQERFIVPFAFGQKEKYIQALQGDPQNDKKVQITLPQMAYTFVDLNYDSSRKLQTTLLNINQTPDHTVNSQYVPVPYNFDIEVYLYVRTFEDGFQIIEQILPFFTPDYTLRVNMIPSMDITQSIPIRLTGVNSTITNYEGEREGETRFIQFTLSFTIMGWLYGPVNPGGSGGHIIREAIVNIWNWKNTDGRYLHLVMQPGGTGNYVHNEIVFQNSSTEHSNASAVVLDWSNTTNRIYVDNVDGTFTTNQTLHGAQSGAAWNLINYEITPQKIETITVTPIPPDVNVGDPFIYNVEKVFYNS